MGVIDENTLNEFRAIIGVGIYINEAKEIIGNYSVPFFHWVIRDFTLKQENSDGRLMNGKEYLDECLKQLKVS